MDILEEKAGFVTVDYEPPIIEDYEKVNRDTPVHPIIQGEMNKAKAYFESL